MDLLSRRGNIGTGRARERQSKGQHWNSGQKSDGLAFLDFILIGGAFVEHITSY